MGAALPATLRYSLLFQIVMCFSDSRRVMYSFFVGSSMQSTRTISSCLDGW